MAFVITRQRTATVRWLVSAMPEQWGERKHAMRFDLRGDARRAAVSIKLSGDWAIEMAPPPWIDPEPPSHNRPRAGSTRQEALPSWAARRPHRAR
jgi:hypothetical protein